MSPEIPRAKLETWVDCLLDHSLGGVSRDDVVMIKGERIAWPLLSVLQDRIFAAGAIADVCLVAPDNDRGKVWGASIARHGSLEQIARVPAWHLARYEAMTKYVEVLGAESPELFDGLPDGTGMALARADKPFQELRLLKPWVITLFPTPGFAAIEGLGVDEYAEVIVAASTQDPRRLAAIEEPICRALERARSLRLVTREPRTGRALELTMRIAGQRIIPCTGRHNVPDGEVFTSPDARTPEGEVFVDLPVFQGGTVIEGVYLRFEGGVIREYTAERGREALARIIETDPGSHRLGEVALGMNSGIDRVLRHPLFVEKIGGTAHIAIGASVAECYVEAPASESGRVRAEELVREGALNRSARHVDIVIDFRGGGAGQALYLDDRRLEVRDGVWVVP